MPKFTAYALTLAERENEKECGTEEDRELKRERERGGGAVRRERREKYSSFFVESSYLFY